MSSAELLPHQLMQIVADFFESRQIPYRVVGSMASMAYGEPRFTNDIDIVAQLNFDNVDALCASFPGPEFYVSRVAIREAIERRSQFNIIHPASGLKADIIVPADDDFAHSEASRIRRITSENEYSAWFCSPEDAILKKLVYYKLSAGTSDKHLRDIAGIMKLQAAKLDHAYLLQWAEKLNVSSELKMVVQRVDV